MRGHAQRDSTASLLLAVNSTCCLPCNPPPWSGSPPLLAWRADVSSQPTIVGTSGGLSGASLRVVRPATMPDDAVATYLIQAYSDAAGTTKVGGSASPARGAWRLMCHSCSAPWHPQPAAAPLALHPRRWAALLLLGGNLPPCRCVP